MSPPYELWMTSSAGASVDLLDPLVSLRYVLRTNGIHELVVHVDANLRTLAAYALDNRLAVYKAGRLEAVFLLRRIGRLVTDDGQKLIELRAVGLNDLLARRIVAYAAGSSQADKSGPADNLIKAVATENLGTGALVSRSLSAYLSVAANTSAGPSVQKSFSRRNVLWVCQELALAAAETGTMIAFDITATSPTSMLTLTTYVGQRGTDRRYGYGVAPVLLSPELGTLGSVERAYDYSREITFVYAAGRGYESDRSVVTAEDTVRSAASVLNLREGYADARNIKVDASLAAEAQAMVRAGQPRQVLKGTVISIPQCAYGVHWFWGDLVSVDAEGEIANCRVDQVEVLVAGAEEHITAGLRSDAASLTDTPIDRLAWQIDRTAVVEAPRVLQVPLAYAVPQAGAAGTLADGWLSSLIARSSDVTAEATARALADTTHAALTTAAHGGVVASTDPRLTDARTPTAHAIGGVLHTGTLTDALHGALSGGTLHATVVAGGAAGFITGADKTKLDGIASGATMSSGTVTSVALSVPGLLFSVGGSPVTSSGTLALSLLTQTANTMLAGPVSGAAATPTMRALVAADIPQVAYSSLSGIPATFAPAAHAASLITSGQLLLARGGSAADLSATGGANQIVRQNSVGGALSVSALAAADIPALDTAKITTGVLPLARGGTGVAAIPAFSAWMTAPQAIAPSTFTKLAINNEFRDTNANYDTTTRRFTPTVAGTYLFTAYVVYVSPTQDQKGFGVYVYKNGARSLVVENYMITSGAGDFGVALTGLLAANGSGDYFELYTVQYTTINVFVWEGGGNFSAVWVGP